MADEDRTDATEETKEETTSTEGPDAIVDDIEVALTEPQETEEPASTEETKEEEPAEAISDEMYAEAGKLGISRSQAESIGVDGLPRVMRKLTMPDSAQTSDAPAVGDAAQETVSGKQADVVLDPDEFDSKLIERIEGIESEVNRRLGPIQDELTRLRVNASLNEEREAKARFDGLIGNLEGFDKEFGTTSPTRTQQGNRSAIRTQMDVERSGRELHDLPVLSDDKLLQRALAGEYPNKAKQQVREEISSTLKTRAKQHISRPTHTQGPKLTGKQKALKKVAAIWEERGLGDLASSDEDDLSILET